MKDSKEKNIILAGKENEYYSSDLSKRYKKKEKTVITTEAKAVSVAKEIWNVVSIFVLLLLASLAVYAFTSPTMRDNLLSLWDLFINEIHV